MDQQVEIFIDIEKKYNLYNLKMNNIAYWEYARFDIWNYIMSSENPQLGAVQNQDKTLSHQMKSGIRLIKTILFGKHVPKGDIDILFLNHERKIKVRKHYECKYTELLRSNYKNSYTFERPYELGHLTPTRDRNLYYLDEIAVKGNLYYQIKRRICKREYSKLKNNILSAINEPISELSRRMNIRLDVTKVSDIILKRMLICRSKKREYEKLFEKVHPKIIIEVVHYNMDCMIVNEIAHEKNIPVIEMQHGNVFESHIAYQYAEGVRLQQLPDEIWLLSEYWKKKMHMPLEDVRLIPMGFPYYEKRREKFQKRYSPEKGKTTVLFVSQGTIGKTLSEFAVDFAGLCDENYKILFKLHPGEVPIWHEKYDKLVACDNIEVIDNRDKDIYQLFAESNIQVGVYSTAIYEGIGFGLRTYICDLPYASEMKDLWEMNLAKLVHTPEELKENIESESKDYAGKEFWTEHSLDNMKKRIEEILNEEIKQ